MINDRGGGGVGGIIRIKCVMGVLGTTKSILPKGDRVTTI